MSEARRARRVKEADMMRPWWTYSLLVGIALSILAKLDSRAPFEVYQAPPNRRRT